MKIKYFQTHENKNQGQHNFNGLPNGIRSTNVTSYGQSVAAMQYIV